MVTYGSLRWTGTVWWSEPVHLSELFQTHVIQILIYRGIHYFLKPSRETVWFLVWSWSEPISLQQLAPRGLVLGPILLDISLSDLFVISNDIDISCYADDNALYKACDSVDAVIEILRMSA